MYQAPRPMRREAIFTHSSASEKFHPLSQRSNQLRVTLGYCVDYMGSVACSQYPRPYRCRCRTPAAGTQGTGPRPRPADCGRRRTTQGFARRMNNNHGRRSYHKSPATADPQNVSGVQPARLRTRGVCTINTRR